MEIKWHGHSAFSFKGEDATLVTDPFENIGVKLPKLNAKVVLVGDELAAEKGELQEIEGAKVIDWPGEFEVAGIGIEGFSAELNARDNDVEGKNVIVYIFVIDGIKICQLGGLSHELTPELIDQIGDVDVLLLPVGGGDVLDAKRAQSTLESVEPRIVIPMYYDETPSEMNIRGAGEFLKLMSKTELVPEKKLVIQNRSALPADNMKFLLLTAQ